MIPLGATQIIRRKDGRRASTALSLRKHRGIKTSNIKTAKQQNSKTAKH
jgi:hypothetical protein